ncbi:MAG: GGDEF and EAL domain-containing protein [Phycisphaeraceae bacterium]|nr:GGDEF and EAL domain-containing protein [Phycisphaeraceae bacterium]
MIDAKASGSSGEAKLPCKFWPVVGILVATVVIGLLTFDHSALILPFCGLGLLALWNCLSVFSITDRRQNAQALWESQRLLSSMLSNLPGMAYRCRNDANWTMELVSDGCLDLTGYTPQELKHNSRLSYASLIHPDDHQQIRDKVQKALTAHQPFQLTYRIQTADGSLKWVWEQGQGIFSPADEIEALEGFITDVTARQRFEEQLEYQVGHDALTNLPNRVLCLQRLSQVVEKSAQVASHSYATLFLDFDRFKLINDSLGHDVGDLFLVTMARRLELFFTTGPGAGLATVFGRLGGDEFMVLLEGLDLPAVTALVQQLEESLSLPVFMDGHEVAASVSVGIAPGDPRHGSAQDVLRDADIALYHAKERGRGCHVVFDRQMHQEILANLELENDLRHALKRDELELWYQPVVDLADGRLTGFEAVLQWHHRRHGLIPHDCFLPVAEDTGLILPIGRWAIAQASRALQEWGPGLTVSMDLFRRQILQPQWIRDLAATVRTLGIEPGRLRLELSESVLMEHLDELLPHLRQLRQNGIKLVMDGFGRGQSSLVRLDQLPIDALKIDRDFVGKMVKNRSLAAVIDATIRLAHNLDIRIIADGVENEGQMAQLLALDCDLAQGPYFSCPLSAAQIVPFIHQPKTWFRQPAAMVMI